MFHVQTMDGAIAANEEVLKCLIKNNRRRSRHETDIVGMGFFRIFKNKHKYS